MKFPSLETKDMKMCCLLRYITHFRGDNRWVWRNCRIVFISSGKPKEVRQKQYHCNYYDSHMKSPRFEPQAHPHKSIVFKLPELCHGDVTNMVLRLYTVLFHIDVPYIKFYICGFQMQILWQK